MNRLHLSGRHTRFWACKKEDFSNQHMKLCILEVIILPFIYTHTHTNEHNGFFLFLLKSTQLTQSHISEQSNTLTLSSTNYFTGLTTPCRTPKTGVRSQTSALWLYTFAELLPLLNSDMKDKSGPSVHCPLPGQPWKIRLPTEMAAEWLMGTGKADAALVWSAGSSKT